MNYLIVNALYDIDPTLAADIRQRLVTNVESDWQATSRFHEFFNGDTGEGLGADFQTGWTRLSRTWSRRAGRRLPTRGSPISAAQKRDEIDPLRHGSWALRRRIPRAARGGRPLAWPWAPARVGGAGPARAAPGPSTGCKRDDVPAPGRRGRGLLRPWSAGSSKFDVARGNDLP